MEHSVSAERVGSMAMGFRKIAVMLASTAAVSLSSTPVLASQIGPVLGNMPGIENVQDHHGWGGGYGGGWGHRDGIDGGDILGGLLIFGAIAAIASSASRHSNQASPPPPVSQNNGYSQQDAHPSDSRPQWRESQSVDAAVDRCVSSVESPSRKVGSVDRVERQSDGWAVSGTTDGRKAFACNVGGDGYVRNVTVDGRAL